MPTEEIKKEMELLGINSANPLPQIGAMLQDNEHLRQFLRKIPAANRRRAYGELLPNLKFKAKPYFLLMR